MSSYKPFTPTKRAPALLTVGVLLTSFLILNSIAPTQALERPNFSVLSSENITIDDSTSVLKVYLNTFRPDTNVSFRLQSNSLTTVTVVSGNDTVAIPSNSNVHFSIKSGPILKKDQILKPVKEFRNGSGTLLIQIFPAPPDFPLITLNGDTSLISAHEILSTPHLNSGSYAIDSVGSDIKYFFKSPNDLVGFRKLNDEEAKAGASSAPKYAFLEQKDFGVTATFPGTWILLDKNFQKVQRINDVQTKFGLASPEGHGMTISGLGNPIVITNITRTVDSSWLAKPYGMPILDCDIAEISGGKAINEFSFWDWAVSNKALSKPLLDAMPPVHDPQDPNSPIDICHANSLQYFKPSNVFLISVRSPSILMILSANLKKVQTIIPTDGSFQHFARFISPTQITALGNFPDAKVSQFLDFKFIAKKWILKKIPFPVHARYCGDAKYVDPTHIWLGGGCDAFTPGTLGAIFTVRNGTLTQLGAINMIGFTFSYRADLLI